MGKKQKKNVAIKEEEDVLESKEDIEIKTEDDIKEEPEDSECKRNRKARLILRNLSFQATEDKLKEHFSKYGTITDVQILKKNGRAVGCGFVEYSSKNCAAKAIMHTSGKPFLNRPVVVDWAVQKGKYEDKSKKVSEDDSEESGFHEETDKKSTKKIKKEDDDESEDSNSEDEDDSGDDDDDSQDSDSNVKHNESDDDSDEEGSDEDDSDMDEDNDSGHKKKDQNQGLTRRKPLRESHDISEGCTVFVKNIPFSVDNEEFKKSMRRFGPVYYALICVDLLTEHSKGTGFVKFRTKEAADACIAAGREGEISIHGSVVETMEAQSRGDLQKGAKKDVKRDTRHLYLVKEGIILAGSPASVGVSQADMAKRIQLEQWKTQMLRNLHKFVSLYRLYIQNLPPSYDDKKLRALMMKYGGKNPVITEARVMRDLRNVDANGVGKSKEYGFVTFTSHENALHALRTLNNNPDVFTPVQRPIVAFSIEDKNAINIRQKRLEKSKAGLMRKAKGTSQKEWESQRKGDKTQSGQLKGKNQQVTGNKVRPTNSNKPLQKTDTPQDSNSSKPISRKERRLQRLQMIQEKKRNRQIIEGGSGNAEGASFIGETAKPGQSGIMTKKKLQAQVQLQNKAAKAKNKRDRKKKQVTEIKIKQPKQKINKAKASKEEKDDHFSNLVNKYKTQLVSSEVERKKWYEQ